MGFIDVLRKKNKLHISGVNEMKTTMIIYESHHGSAKKAAMILGTVIGNTKVYEVSEAPGTTKFNSIVAVFDLYGPDTAVRIVEYLKKVKEQIAEKPMAVIGVGLSQMVFPAVCEKIMEATGRKKLETFFTKGELRIYELTDVERKELEHFSEMAGIPLMDKGKFDIVSVIDIAKNLALKYRTPEKAMPKEYLKEKIEEFIKAHNTLALATGKDEWVRCTPLEYVYIDGMFYIISEGGLKFKGLWQNENVSVGICERYQEMGKLKGMQITGRAKFVELFSSEYKKVLAARNIAVEKVDQMPSTLYMIRICPVKYEILNSDFKNDGFDVKQILELNNK